MTEPTRSTRACSGNGGNSFAPQSVAEGQNLDLTAPLADLARWLNSTQTPAVVVGGVAVSLLARPRFTQDIDALAWLEEPDWERVLAAAPEFGFVPRIDDPLDFARRTRVLLLRHAATSIDLDLILGGLPFEQQIVEQGRLLEIGGIGVRLPLVEHLLIMKAVAHRPRDLQDIRALLDAHPQVNLDEVRRWLREFATATAMSELIEDFERIVAEQDPS